MLILELPLSSPLWALLVTQTNKGKTALTLAMQYKKNGGTSKTVLKRMRHVVAQLLAAGATE